MITRSKRGVTDEKVQKKGKVKVGKLKLNKATVQNVTDSEAKKVKGGLAAASDTTSKCLTCGGSALSNRSGAGC